MRIAILGTRGIPNQYGGFEACAQELGPRLVAKGHEVYVYNSHRHPFREKEYRGVSIIHKYDPENRLGTSGQFIYDLNCLLDARKRNLDVILMLGYTSSSIWYRWISVKGVLFTNMDGLEWKRSKYGKWVKRFLHFAEGRAAKYSDVLVADNTGIRDYLSRYQTNVVEIAYGAEIPKKPEQALLEEYGLQAGAYVTIIARMEPENQLEKMLTAFSNSQVDELCLVVGNKKTAYGRNLEGRFTDRRIRFIGGVYESEKLQALRYYARLHLHGHSVGGTNPSLLEAMAAGNLIVAHDNPFNRSVLGEDALYFKEADDLRGLLEADLAAEQRKQMSKENLRKIRDRYNWDTVADQYEIAFEQALL